MYNEKILEKAILLERVTPDIQHLKVKLKKIGFKSYDEFIAAKNLYFLKKINLKVEEVEISDIPQRFIEIIKNQEFGIYVPSGKGTYAFHGDDKIDIALCQELSVFPLHLNYRGGTIIGDSEDLSFLILCPLNLKFNSGFILQGIKLILSQYFENVTILGNDILIDNKKICGAMSAEFNNCFLWGAQISYTNKDNLINKICVKQAKKEPGQINKNILPKEELKKQLLDYLN